jgi:hypothetical protein
MLMWFGLSSINPIHANLQILPSYPYQFYLTLYRMARTKLTPRKMTGTKGVPRHQLAPRNDGAVVAVLIHKPKLRGSMQSWQAPQETELYMLFALGS